MGSSPARIDVHHHVVPPAYADLLKDKGIRPGGVDVPSWTAERALRLMDRNGIATSILSLSTPGAWFGDDRQARRTAREVNDYAAGVVADHPHRFGFFATLTLPDLAGALAEAEYALDSLGADGIVLLSNVAGCYPYEKDLEPLLAYLHARRAVVFLHPGELPAEPAPGIPSFTADFLLDTVRAATGLVLSGALEKYDGIRWILSHAGGFLPYIAHRVLLTMIRDEPRLAQAKAMVARKRERERRLDVLRRFYFDVALSSTPHALPSLLSFADPTHVLYGSDYPFAPAPAVRFMRQEYEDIALKRRQRAAIDRTNALGLFPRIAGRTTP
ncbi:amidohydrolase family protein [Nocardioides nitrophenolicus]|uniref:amidohydrolase family protein n=1 Tax=Nocardioides nitrophenolicus TaxID=60489 RepID=UPI0019579F43|nr:amidohydrolase family protein [Nocardioides nitrophenolicus]MBM7517509.1 putative TIM-barrel fold metal-dependent hydrolase [Nocardioides nitrophenolicus]